VNSNFYTFMARLRYYMSLKRRYKLFLYHCANFVSFIEQDEILGLGALNPLKLKE
jgi:hypothetical protein